MREVGVRRGKRFASRAWKAACLVGALVLGACGETPGPVREVQPSTEHASDVRTYLAALRSGTPNEVAGAAVERLAELGPASVPEIVRLLDESEDALQVRRCIGVLTTIGPDAILAARPWLEQRAQYDDLLGVASAEALRELRREPTGGERDAHESWEEWWEANKLDR